VGLWLDLLFSSIGLPVCFCAITMLGFLYGSVVSFFAQKCFGYLRSFVFPYLPHDCFFYFSAECHWNFDRDCIEHVDDFGSMAIFTMLILLTHEHGRSFHLLMSSLIFLFSGL
jgi:hypothetical protein